MKAKTKALHKMKKVHHSTEYCKHCGEKTSTHTRFESGHREYDHEKHIDKTDRIVS